MEMLIRWFQGKKNAAFMGSVILEISLMPLKSFRYVEGEKGGVARVEWMKEQTNKQNGEIYWKFLYCF